MGIKTFFLWFFWVFCWGRGWTVWFIWGFIGEGVVYIFLSKNKVGEKPLVYEAFYLKFVMGSIWSFGSIDTKDISQATCYKEAHIFIGIPEEEFRCKVQG